MGAGVGCRHIHAVSHIFNCFHAQSCGDNAQVRVSNARCRRNSIKPGATPQVFNHRTIVALQAQKKSKQSAMSLLRWPRRSLLSIKVAVGVTAASQSMIEAVVVWAMGTVDIIPADLTLRYFCACSAHCCVGDYTWGVAPGFILLRFQRALFAETLAQVQ